MKTLAGLQFQQRNANKEAKGKKYIKGAAKKMVDKRKTTNIRPATRPSRPSMKLIRLIRPADPKLKKQARKEEVMVGQHLPIKDRLEKEITKERK